MRPRPAAAATIPSKPFLLAEFIGLYIGSPIAFMLLGRQGLNPIPILLVIAVITTSYLIRDKGFSRSSFGNLLSLQQHWQRIWYTFLPLSLLTLVTISLLCPQYLFFCPKNNTSLWLSILIFYPLLSVYPQEVIYRGFLFRRYETLFPNKRSMIHASALVFAFAHIIYGNIPAILLTLIGGYFFAITYQRSHSLLTVSVEHALYGCLLFTIGLGRFLLSDISSIL